MAVDELIEEVVRDVAELPDRTSPDDWPEAMLVTTTELRGILRRYFACPECLGSGTITKSDPPHEFANQYQEPCPACEGTGLREGAKRSIDAGRTNAAPRPCGRDAGGRDG